MNLIVEVRQVVFSGPGANLILGPIRMTIVVITVTIVLVQPLLIVPLQLIVEDDSVD
ncbi:MAG: hypothetical protein H0W08_16235 [Acidobacteria bacterium]|nr:hypothetical protein [Acidobacteriota bacterium]